jgi:hypothetical protein
MEQELNIKKRMGIQLIKVLNCIEQERYAEAELIMKSIMEWYKVLDAINNRG